MFGIWKDRVTELEKKISATEKEIEAAQARGKLLFHHGSKFAKQIDAFFGPQLAENESELEKYFADCNVTDVRGWETEHWQAWKPSEAYLNDYIRIGEQVESRGNRDFAVPHFAPFIGENKTLIIVSDDHSVDAAIALLQSLAVRIALTLPHQSRFTLVDPVGAGAAFPMQRSLPFVRETSDDIRRDLDQVSADIRRINATYLDASADSFERLPEDIRINERLEFILAANFPREYDRRAIEALYSIGRTGPKAGKYLILHYNQSQTMPRDMSISGFENSAYIRLNEGYSGSDATACQLKFVPDRAPSAHLQTELFEKLSQAKPPQRDLAWDKTAALPSEDWWQEKAQVLIETPIGGFGSNELLKVWFGEKGESPCAHGILGGTTGSGKSTLYHVMIMGLAVRYAPDDLKMYLVDGKSGVTFQPYRDLPHAEVVSLRTMPELSRSVLAELVAEMDYRYEIFGSVGVEKLADYYNQGQPQGKLPRILLLVDEYQELFEGDQDGIASSHLLKLAQQGRAAGIHMLLGSQGFSAVGMLHRDDIFRNIHLMMAMRMRFDDVQALTNFGRRGKQLIMTCDLPGKIVLNDQLGDDGANTLGKVALLESDERDRLVQQLYQKAHAQFSADDLPLRVVLDGKEQPNLIENPQLRNLLEHATWLTPKEWQAKARQARQHNGLDIADWFSAERPNAMWLGQEFSVHGQAMMVTRRRITENAVLVGSENTATYGMLVGMLVSLAVNLNPQAVKFYILDRSMPETQWCEALRAVHQAVFLPAGFSSTFTRSVKNISGYIETLLDELERRLALEEDERIAQPSIFVVMTELDKVDEIRRQMDEYGTTVYSELGEKLRRLCSEGSRLGIHIILSFSGLQAMLNVIDDRRDLVLFRHRVALQMSEDDSFTFVRNRAASRLQLDGNKPISALYLDVESDRSVRFKPYSTEAKIPLVEQLEQVAKILTQWSQNL
ncbi:FtsK/SpoIIIE domain-containing protein [Picosynechococcus sp. NKBG042902]|uniref:FtsK/SpoIIIE domain-containing protein n=1 Tax=Picosynechococcus sp. NKBG042902 TaxID=490193 RepID=UPI0004AB3694|nr:FtsK/SpoIIIE domain-containing protein [Picosynechococcus sp. NKBG042902]